MPLVTVRGLRDASDQKLRDVSPHSASRVSPAIGFDCAGGIPRARRILRASSMLANGDFPWIAGDGQDVRDQPVQILCLQRRGAAPDAVSQRHDGIVSR